ncbi:CGNR zinc finger domain-containing protein [Streptomyces sp. MI02-7b]|uniref:CGNR zinc finger domain-containing protein n=1 Tax=Streptomyces sp. MI02-7b TaxID=462941 RepID=UPI0029B23977|nr:CGNR zinc finger domain-containing protein [Streptomyces sp. MI02-7b]MDX3072720.1 CGNR zinc finger domain-containing protein [Streptomyces sp. MI02-7b]
MSIQVRVEEVQAAGFPMGGEPLVALDLADTVMMVAEPPVDLMEPASAAAAWWEIQSRRLPPGPAPAPVAARRLRAAIREVLDAHLEDRPADAAAVDDINAAASSVPASPRLVVTGDGPRAATRWHTEHGGNAALAAIAGEAIALLGSPDRLRLLRRCANPECSMLFLAENPRRKWCTSNICGNRARVARHYARTHAG